MPIEVCPSERALLNCFFARIHRFDPDIITGHNIVAFDLEVLLTRAKHNKCANWDRLGRLKRGSLPMLRGGKISPGRHMQCPWPPLAVVP